MSKPIVTIIFSAYNPDPNFVEKVLRLSNLVNDVIIVEDGTKTLKHSDFEAKANVKLISLEQNGGIVHALNLGLAEAQPGSADFVFTLDQDSDIADDFLDNALAVWNRAQEAGIKTGIIAPAFINDIFVATKPDELGFIHLEDVILSGSLIPLQIFDEVGVWDEGLYMDAFDQDFTSKLLRKGYQLLATPENHLIHSLGEKQPITIFGWMPTHKDGTPFGINTHAPFRTYYMNRNVIEMIRRYGEDFPRFKAIKRLYAIQTFVICILYSNRFSQLRAFLRGRRDGKKGILGRIPADLERRLR